MADVCGTATQYSCQKYDLNTVFRGGSRYFHILEILESKNWNSKQFGLRKLKDTETKLKAKIKKHGEKKNDKDEIGNNLLKHVFIKSIIQLVKGRLSPVSVYGIALYL